MPPVSPLLEYGLATLKMPSNERNQERVHLLGVLMTDHMRAWPSKLTYSMLCEACRALQYASVPPRVRLTDADETGQQHVFRVILTGAVLVQRRFGHKAWLPIGFLRPGDTLGLPAMLDSTPDDIRYTTLSETAEFAVLRRFEFERSLRVTYENAMQANIEVLRSHAAFAPLPTTTLKQLVSSSRLITLPPGELLTREGDATDELLVLKSGVVRLVKNLNTSETFTWPTSKRPQDAAGDISEFPGSRLISSLDGALDYSEVDVAARSDHEQSAMRPADLYREGATIHRSRLVVVREVREGAVFAYDEAVAVIRRVAAARAAKTTSANFKGLPPIRRNVTAFCLTDVSAIAISPIILILFVGNEKLPAFLRSFGPARTSQVLDKQLRQQREWHKFKQQLLKSTEKPQSRLQEFIGPRRYARAAEESELARNSPRLGGAMSARRTHSNGGRQNGTGRSLLDGLGAVVNGMASAELASASSDLGTAITETYRHESFLRPTNAPPLRPRFSTSINGAEEEGEDASGLAGPTSEMMSNTRSKLRAAARWAA